MSMTPQNAASPHVDTFLVYLSAHPNIRPRHTLVARAAATAKLPTLSYTMPSGTIVVFPEFLAFLTREKASPGAGVIWNQVVDQAHTLMTLHRWAYHPASMLGDIAKMLGTTVFANEDKLAEALANRNSFFIPLERLTGITVGRRSAREGRQVYLSLNTLDGPYMICEDAATEGWFTSMGSMFGLAEWQPELIALLRSAAARNAAPATAASPKSASATAASPKSAPASTPPPTAPGARSIPDGQGNAQAANAAQTTSPRPTSAAISPGVTRTGTQPSSQAGSARGPVASPNPPLRVPSSAKAQATTASAAQPRRGSGGCGVLITLLLVGLVVGGIALSQQHNHAGGVGGGSSIPDVSGTYTGTAHNGAGFSAPMSLTLDEQGTSLSGTFAVSRPLGGSGPLQGEVDASGDVTFEVVSSDGSNVVIDFTGSLTSDGNELTGTYTVNNGQSGTWDVAR